MWGKCGGCDRSSLSGAERRIYLRGFNVKERCSGSVGGAATHRRVAVTHLSLPSMDPRWSRVVAACGEDGPVLLLPLVHLVQLTLSALC